MAGKLGGIGLAGLLQFAIWIAVAALMSGGDQFGGSAAWLELADVPAGTFVAFGGFFVLGFALYGALYAGLGAGQPDRGRHGAGAARRCSSSSASSSRGRRSATRESIARVLSFVPPLTPRRCSPASPWGRRRGGRSSLRSC